MSAKEMKISDIIELAANEYLAVDETDLRKTSSSCCAISDASEAVGQSYYGPARAYAESWLQGSELRGAFLSELSITDRQQIRYSWLMLVAQFAREEGL